LETLKLAGLVHQRRSDGVGPESGSIFSRSPILAFGFARGTSAENPLRIADSVASF